MKNTRLENTPFELIPMLRDMIFCTCPLPETEIYVDISLSKKVEVGSTNLRNRSNLRSYSTMRET